MHPAVSMRLPHKSAPARIDREILVAISADSATLRADIEARARRAGVRVVADGAKHDVLLLLVSSFSPPAEASMSANVCAIWTEGSPARSDITRFVRAGFAGIVSIDATAAELHAALQAIVSGLQVVDRRFIRTQPGTLVAAPSTEELTSREQQVLTLMAEGLSNKEISSRLVISTHTVKFHISSILG